jgi:hypothetical protein
MRRGRAHIISCGCASGPLASGACVPAAPSSARVRSHAVAFFLLRAPEFSCAVVLGNSAHATVVCSHASSLPLLLRQSISKPGSSSDASSAAAALKARRDELLAKLSATCVALHIPLNAVTKLFEGPALAVANELVATGGIPGVTAWREAAKRGAAAADAVVRRLLIDHPAPVCLGVDRGDNQKGTPLLAVTLNHPFLGSVLADVAAVPANTSVTAEYEAQFAVDALKKVGVSAFTRDAVPGVVSAVVPAADVISRSSYTTRDDPPVYYPTATALKSNPLALRQWVSAGVSDNASTAKAALRNLAEACVQGAVDGSVVPYPEDKDLLAAQMQQAQRQVLQLPCVCHCINLVAGSDVFEQVLSVKRLLQSFSAIAGGTSYKERDSLLKENGGPLERAQRTALDSDGDRWASRQTALAIIHANYSGLKAWAETRDAVRLAEKRPALAALAEIIVSFHDPSCEYFVALLVQLFEAMPGILAKVQTSYIGALSSATLDKIEAFGEVFLRVARAPEFSAVNMAELDSVNLDRVFAPNADAFAQTQLKASALPGGDITFARRRRR